MREMKPTETATGMCLVVTAGRDRLLT